MKQKSDGSKSFVWVLWVFPLFLTIGLIFLMFKPKEKSWGEQGRVPATPARKILALWSNATFVPIERGAPFETLLGNIPVSFVNFPPQTNQIIEKREAVEAARHLLYGLAYKDAKEYLAFRLPADSFTLDQSIRGYRISELRKIFPEDSDIAKFSPPDLVEKWFQSRFVPRSTNGAPLRDQTWGQLATKISIEESEIIIERLKALPISLNLFITKRPNAGYVNQRSWVDFQPSPVELLRKDGFLDYCVLKLHLMPKADPPMPVYFSFYWDDGKQKWLPMEQAIPFSEFRRQDYAF